MDGVTCKHLGQILLIVSAPCPFGAVKNHAVRHCPKKTACIATWKPDAKREAEWRKKNKIPANKIALCHGCPHFTPPA